MTEQPEKPTKITLLEGEESILLEHEADGIKELDNNLPRWWLWLFYITIVFAVVYMGYYHVFAWGKSSAEAYADEIAAGEALKAEAAKEFQTNLATMEPSTEADVLAKGQQTFVTLCAPCHRADGGGLVGPNLCDDFWIHGDTFGNSLTIILNGNPVKGMIAWKDTLAPRDIYAVASYIYTLRGTNPPNPKPPENQVSNEPEEPSEFE